jgi:hypothetical protein
MRLFFAAFGGAKIGAYRKGFLRAVALKWEFEGKALKLFFIF